MDREFLCSLSPIFRLKDTQIIWSGNVYKVGQTNCLHSRLLVIASPGIFLIRRKSFNFQSRIITSISFFDLVSLYVTDQYASFSSKQSQIRVKLQNTKEIISLVVFIRQAQFPTDVLPLNFTFVNEEMANLCTPAQLPYQPSSLFLDRTLSCILHFEIIPSDNLLSEIPTQFFRRYTIQNEMLQNPIYPAWILSLSYDRDVEILRFKSIRLYDFLKLSQYLFAYNKFIKAVEFEKVDFSNSEQILSQLFNRPHRFKPIRWVFIECDITNPSFCKFFNSISLIDKKIADIQFVNCTFSEDILMETFQSIFFNECFHSISNFQFNSNIITSGKGESSNFSEGQLISPINELLLSQISEILSCSWVLQQKCLTRLSLVSSGVDDMTPILSQIFTFDTGLRFISLNGNSFISPIAIREESGSTISISLISFRNSRLSKSFILSLISLIKNGKIVFEGIDLSGIAVIHDQTEKIQINQNEFNDDNQNSNNEEEEQSKIQLNNDNQVLNPIQRNENLLDFLLNELEEISMPSLETLFFDENLMDTPQAVKFINFLYKQPNLKNLSVNCSFDIRNSPYGLLSFIDYCSSQDLSVLSIRGDNSIQTMELSFGLLNLNLIQKIQSIECLDISDQKIGQKGLELLLPLIINGKLKEIYFDGSNVSSFHFLCQFCTTLITSKIKYASFPENDFQRILNVNTNSNCISLIPVPDKDDYFSAYNDLKNKFESFFYISEHNCSTTIINKTLKKIKIPNFKETKEKKVQLNNQPLFIKNQANGILVKSNDEIKLNNNNNNPKNLKIIENCIFNHKIHDLFNECFTNCINEPSETISLLNESIQDSLSFDNLLNSFII